MSVSRIEQFAGFFCCDISQFLRSLLLKSESFDSILKSLVFHHLIFQDFVLLSHFYSGQDSRIYFCEAALWEASRPWGPSAVITTIVRGVQFRDNYKRNMVKQGDLLTFVSDLDLGAISHKSHIIRVLLTDDWKRKIFPHHFLRWWGLDTVNLQVSAVLRLHIFSIEIITI